MTEINIARNIMITKGGDVPQVNIMIAAKNASLAWKPLNYPDQSAIWMEWRMQSHGGKRPSSFATFFSGLEFLYYRKDSEDNFRNGMAMHNEAEREI